MPGPSIQEQDVSNYWAQNYNPVTDVAATGHYYLEDGTYGTMTEMTDGSIWFDHHNDGWFDVGRREIGNGVVEEYDGRWNVLSSASLIELPEGGLRNSFAEPTSSVLVIEPSSLDTGWFLLE